MELRLTEAVQTLRDELTEAIKQAEDADLAFDVGPIGMEFEVAFRVDAKAKGKVAAWIVSGEAEAGAGRTHSHRVSFTLTPRSNTSPNGDVSINSTRQHADPGDRSGRIGR
ncbi:trypco2 family protein [Nocardiopsis sp. NPDC055879]